MRNADWNRELGALAETVPALIEEPAALMFDEIEGYPKGFRVLSIPTASRVRMAIALGLPPDPPKMAIRRHAAQRLTHPPPLPPKALPTGPALQNIMHHHDAPPFQSPPPHSHRPAASSPTTHP